MDNFSQNAQFQMNPSQVVTSPTVVCPKCGSKVFTNGFVLKRISPLVSPSGKEELYPIPVFACASCGTVPKEFMDKPNAKKIFGEDVENKEETKLK